MSYYANEFIVTTPSSHQRPRYCIDMTSPNLPQYDWTSVSEPQDYIEHTRTTSSINSPHGLGLGGLPLTASPAYFTTDVDARQSSTSLSFNWMQHSTLAPTALTYPPPFRLRQSWNEGSCDPLSTLMPSGAWDVPQPVGEAGDMCGPSPAMSQYSPESHPSTASTPYARSDSVLRSAGSPPQIKIESVATPAPVFGIGFFQNGLPEQTIAERFDDMLSESSDPIDLQIQHTLQAPVGDFKVPKTRPMRRRAFSSEGLLADRKKRGYTRPNEAKCSCHQCGKLFQRTYNLKAHMDTHDPDRDQPHICYIEDCSKRFVRRTDLVRHQQSVSLVATLYEAPVLTIFQVHYKERNHSCPLCGNCFARKDTLRR